MSNADRLLGESEGAKSSQEDVRKRLLDALRQTFRPEFLNRVDDIIVFNTLSKEHLSVIIDLQLKRLEKHAGRPRRETGGDASRERSDHGRRLRSGLRRAADAARDPAADSGPAGAAAAGRRIPRGETIVVDQDGDSGKLKFEKQTQPEPATV